MLGENDARGVVKHTNLHLPVSQELQTIKFVTYYRVSTNRQGRSGLGLDAQRSAVSQYLTSKNGIVIAEYVEVESGGKDDRPKLLAALEECRRKKASLLIAKLDRLARSVSFVSGLMEGQVDFIAVDMPHASRFVLHIMSAVAEHERQLISERTRAALGAAKARGILLGANGAKLAKLNKEAAAAYARQVAPKIWEAVATGAKTAQQIAAILNKTGLPSRQGGRWYAANVARVLHRLPEWGSHPHQLPR